MPNPQVDVCVLFSLWHTDTSMKEHKISELEIVIAQMRELQAQHPKATITFNSDLDRVHVSYPLPNNYWEIQKVEFLEKKPLLKNDGDWSRIKM